MILIKYQGIMQITYAYVYVLNLPTLYLVSMNPMIMYTDIIVVNEFDNECVLFISGDITQSKDLNMCL